MASVSAITADRLSSLEHPGPVFVHGEAARDGSDRADLDAAAAELAVKRMGTKMFDLGHGAASGWGEGLHVHDFIAVSDAAEALHTAVHLRFDQRAEIVFWKDPLGFGEPASGR